MTDASKPRSTTAAFLLVLGLVLVPPVHAQQDDPDGPKRPPEPGLREEILELYERAREAGEDVPKSVYDWTRADLQTIGDWEYMVLEIDDSDATLLEAKLNELGQERWELIWLRPAGGRTRYILKRPARSWLQQIPLSQLMKLVPLTGEPGGE